MLDSGTTFTYLPTAAYTAFKDAVIAFALSHGLHSISGTDPTVCTTHEPKQLNQRMTANTELRTGALAENLHSKGRVASCVNTVVLLMNLLRTAGA